MAQNPQATGQAAYSAAQADAGAVVYGKACAVCHGASLQGDQDSPQLAGTNFRTRWGDKPVADLIKNMQERMPTAAPGSLSQNEYVALTAYVLRQNGVAPGAAQLSFASTARTFAAGPAGGPRPAAAPIYPAAGRVGNTRSPASLDRRVSPAEVHESPTGRTATFHRADRFTPVTDAELQSPPAGDWLNWRGTLNSWGYSRLSQINAQNVSRLQLAWAWGMEDGNAEADPLVRNGIVYIPNPGNVIQALDGKDGTLLWEYRYKFAEGINKRGRMRNIAVWDDMIFLATEPGVLVALDARTGQVRWETVMSDTKDGFENTSGPIVVDGKLINGRTQCSRFVLTKCFISAHDARTGKELWRTSTVAKPGEPGGETWGNLPVEFRTGADPWIPGSYDPVQRLVYFGTAQAKPWVADSRGLTTEHATLYANSTLAMDPETGRIVWYFQHVPGESLDLDNVYERVLVDVNGRSVALTVGKDGLLWKLDRKTGAFLDVVPTIYQDIYENIDRKTGKVTYRKDIREAKVTEWISACPSTAGGHNWYSTAYHPGTGNLYIPEAQTCFEIRGRVVKQELGGSAGAQADRAFLEAPGTNGNTGRLAAWNAATMTESWNVQQRSEFTTAVLTTAGGLVFVGDHDRWFHAYDAATGKELWKTRLATSVQGFPVAYEVDGVQYVAVPTGRLGGSPWNVTQLLTPEIETPSADRHNGLYVFRLSP